MKSTTRRAYVLYALVIFFFVGLGILLFTFVSNSSNWALNRANKHVYQGNMLSVAGTIYDKNGKELVKTVNEERIYNENVTIRKSVLHAIGDATGFISTGVQSVYNDDLIGYNFINGIYGIQENGVGNNIRLTLDADVNAAAYNALNGRKGAICVYNYKTGEIIAMVSAPTYDLDNKPSEKEIAANPKKYEGLYLNRVLSGVFTPGSTFKVLTAISAVDNIPDIDSQKFHCNGTYKVPGGGTVKCHDVHGTINFQTALTRSCNAAFANIAVQLGNEKLSATMTKLGFNTPIKMDRTIIAQSTFDLSNAVNIDLGWAGIGQYTTLVNPYHMMLIMGSIANGGTSPMPYLVSRIETQNGFALYKGSAKNAPNFIDLPTAEKVSQMMRNSVKNYYGDKTFPGLELAGKTGTAEVEGEESHAWFVGFSTKADCPLAFAVVIQNGGAGFQQAMPVANKVMQAAYESIKNK